MVTHFSVLAWRIPGTGACWAAVYRVAQSQTRLTQLSSSSNYALNNLNILVNELGLMKGTG